MGMELACISECDIQPCLNRPQPSRLPVWKRQAVSPLKLNPHLWALYEQAGQVVLCIGGAVRTGSDDLAAGEAAGKGRRV